MKFLIIHNQYSKQGGEEQVVAMQKKLLQERGHAVVEYRRHHGEVGRFKSFFTAIHNQEAINDIEKITAYHQPDVAIIHNLFPIISAAIIPTLKKANVKTLMTLHNYRLACPNGLFFTHGKVCEKCGNSPLGTLNCVKYRCQGSFAGSVAWGARGSLSRKYFNQIDHFMALSQFQIDKITEYCNLSAERFSVVPNCIDIDSMPASTEEKSNYIGFVGRLSEEKGVNLLFKVARMLPDIRFRVAGEKADNFSIDHIPSNMELVGFLNREQLADFYTAADKIIITSSCYEGFPLTAIEAMYYGATVVVPNWAAFSEIPSNCALHYTPNSAEELVKHITSIVDLGDSPRNHVLQNHNSDIYYQNLINCI